MGQLLCRSACFHHILLHLPLLGTSGSTTLRGKPSEILPVHLLSSGHDSTPCTDPHSCPKVHQDGLNYFLSFMIIPREKNGKKNKTKPSPPSPQRAEKASEAPAAAEIAPSRPVLTPKNLKPFPEGRFFSVQHQLHCIKPQLICHLLLPSRGKE